MSHNISNEINNMKAEMAAISSELLQIKEDIKEMATTSLKVVEAIQHFCKDRET